jgi:predicted RND superfamily exporter protein
MLVLGALVVVIFASAEGVRRLSFDSDVLTLLPQSGRITPAFREFLARFGSLDQLYVVFTAPAGFTIDAYRDDIDAWVGELRGAPEIARVDTGVLDVSRDIGWLADRQLLLLRGAALDEALRRLEPAGLTGAVASSRELLTVPSPQVAELVRQDPAGLLTLLRTALGGTQAGVNIGASTDGYVTPDGRRRLVTARPKRPPYDAAFSRALDVRLRNIETAMRNRTAAARRDTAGNDDDAPPPMTIEFVGGHRVAVETEAVVKWESIASSVGSLALILPLLFLVFRSVWLVAVGPLPAALSLLVVLGALGFVGTRLSAAATGSAAMLFGLGIDGVVLLYVAYQLPRQSGGPPEGGPHIRTPDGGPHTRTPGGGPDIQTPDGGPHIGPPEGGPHLLAGPATSMLLGMWTTAATFYGLTFVDFPSLQQLGLLIGHSMMICSVLTLLLVPALLPRHPPTTRARALTMPRLAAWVETHRRGVMVAALVVTVALGASSMQLRINPTLDRLRSVTPAARLEVETGEAFGLPSDIYVILAEGEALEPLLDANERLAERLATELPALAFQPPTRLLPSAAAQARTAARIDEARLSAGLVRASLERARIESGFREGAFEPFAARVGRLLDSTQRLSYDDYAAHGLDDLMQRFIVRDGARWLLATYAFPTTEDQAARLQAIIAEVDATQTLTGLQLVNGELSRRFGPEFLKGLGIGAILVVLIIVAAFRDWRLSMFALLPTVLGLVWTSGLLALGGVELDLFAVFAVVTLLGIGVDYGVHLVHRCRERGDPGRATAELAPVILIAAAITILGYGTLITSSYPPLRSIGLVSVVSVVALAVASVFVLPALLAGRRA